MLDAHKGSTESLDGEGLRFIDKSNGAQWWILEMNDNRGHRVYTST